MAIWKEQNPPRKDEVPFAPDPAHKKEPDARIELSPAHNPVRRTPDREAKESLIAAELTIEGKVQGSGHIRIAGRFNGDVHVQGNLAIEAGAKLTGGVHANTVTIAGELEGNISGASRVELLESGVLIGDLKAGSLVVAAGSRMRGQVEFGWDEKSAQKSAVKLESGSAA
jgi:cytoskeletal protein CcmA (bactofilin family)